MNKYTLKALKGSIKKWEKIVAGKGDDMGWFNCPLCLKFSENFCKGCPVSDKTGVVNCRETPYGKWVRSFGKRIVYPLGANTPKRVELAKEELEFLKSLLPKDKA